MKRLPSIRQRLSIALVGITLAWGVAVSAVVWVVVHHAVDELLDSRLQESAEILFGLLSVNVAQLPLNSGGSLPAPPHEEHLVWQIVSDSNRVLLRSHRAPDQPLSLSGSKGFTSVDGGWRVYGLGFDGNGRVLYVAQRSTEREAARAKAATATAAAALVVGLIGALWLRSRVRRELEPISELSASVALFDPLAPDARLAASTRAELVPMQNAINDLGARLAKRLVRERAFSAHAAHALRTPLAGMVAQLAVAQRLVPPEAQPQLKRAREAADRMRRVVTALLTLFRASADPKVESVNLADLVTHLSLEKLSVKVEGNERIEADPDLLAAALMNLLDNSLRYGARKVTVSSRRAESGSSVVVSDDGAGVDENERERLQQALEKQNYEGQTGLGLMLADLVARAHGGRVLLLPTNTGFSVELGLGVTNIDASTKTR